MDLFIITADLTNDVSIRHSKMEHYQIGGSLSQDYPYYVQRQADLDLYRHLKMGQFCYVFNARQMGKSSLMVRVFHQLQQEGVRCAAIDLSRIGSDTITLEQWYKGFAVELWQAFDLFRTVNLKTWWQDHADISPVQRLGQFIEQVLLVDDAPQTETLPPNLVLFLDEVDSVRGLGFRLNDFFALIRACYNRRSFNPAYQRLTVALLGVATPSDLITDCHRTPFNIGRAIALDGFQWEEAQPLIRGLVGYADDPHAALQEILTWTGGQPFLTQKVCQFVVEHGKKVLSESPSGDDRRRIAEIVQRFIVQSWEFQDEPEHLRTIRDRLLGDSQKAGRLLGLYQQILTMEPGASPGSSEDLRFEGLQEHLELLLTGLVVNRQGYLAVKNPIYQAVFSPQWVNHQLAQLRPYAAWFDRWMASGQQAKSYLLQGQVLQDTLVWALGKKLSDDDYQFLVASQDLAKQETQTTLDALERASQLLSTVRQRVNREMPNRRIGWGWVPKIALGVATPILVLRLLGVWQGLEWDMLDQFFRWRPLESIDQRITLITIDEGDITQFGYPISDRLLAQGITTLNAHHPRAIGLDLYRNLPVEPGHAELVRVFQSMPNVFGIAKRVGETVAPPPTLQQLGQVGFSDQVEDSDGKVRRGLLSIIIGEQLQYGLAAQLALHYLAADGITLEASDAEGSVRLGKAIVEQFDPNAGGYVRAQSGGYQILLNFHGTEANFDRFSLRQVLSQQVPADRLRDRLIFIGTTAASVADVFQTPYSGGTARSTPMAGVTIHANIASQLLSAALDGRPLIRVWADPVEWGWILMWACIGAGISWRYRSPMSLTIAAIVVGSGLVGGSYVAFLQGWWVPVVPALAGLGVAAIALFIVTQDQRDHVRFDRTLDLLMQTCRDYPTAGRIAIEYLKQSETKKNQAVIEQRLNKQ